MRRGWRTPLTENQEKVLEVLRDRTSEKIASTVSLISRKCRLPFSTTHDCLRKLERQGYAKKIRIPERGRRSRRKYWIAI